MKEEQDQSLSRLKLIRVKASQDQVKAEESTTYIFRPKNDLEEIAIAIAIDGHTGWQDSLYSLDYVDHYLEHTCLIFATRPEESKDQQWLLVNLDGRYSSSYWIALGEKQLLEAYYAWAKIVGNPNPHFNPQSMMP